jgi:hypothetical protein
MEQETTYGTWDDTEPGIEQNNIIFDVLTIGGTKALTSLGSVGLRGTARHLTMGSRVIGKDIATMINAANIVEREGIETVLLHGNATGFVVDGMDVSAKEVARNMLANGYQKGTPILLVSCKTGVWADGAAYQLSRYLKASVTAPTNDIFIQPGGMPYVLYGGTMETFFNTTIK